MSMSAEPTWRGSPSHAAKRGPATYVVVDFVRVLQASHICLFFSGAAIAIQLQHAEEVVKQMIKVSSTSVTQA